MSSIAIEVDEKRIITNKKPPLIALIPNNGVLNAGLAWLKRAIPLSDWISLSFDAMPNFDHYLMYKMPFEVGPGINQIQWYQIFRPQSSSEWI